MTDQPPQDHDWLEWRRGGVGASDIAAAHTGSYGGLYGVVAAKLGHPTGDDIDPALAERGKRWEQPIADAVHALTGYYVHGEQMLIEAANNKRWRCTLDGLVDPRPSLNGIDDAEATLEVKTVGLNARWNHDYYVAQMQWQMLVTGKVRGLLAVARIDDTDDTCRSVHLEWVDADPFLTSALIDLADTILTHVDAGTLPEPDEATDPATVKQANADATPIYSGRKIVPDPAVDLTDIHNDMARYLDVCEAHKALDDEKKLLENRFRHHMGEHVLAEDDRFRLKVGEAIDKFTAQSEVDALELWPDYAKPVLDRARFKAERPDDYEALKRPTTDRRITVKDLTR